MAGGNPLRVVVKELQGAVVFPENALSVTDFRGSEAISQLFGYELFLTPSDGKPVAFEKMLGKQVTLTLTLEKDKKRFFHGICNTISEAPTSSSGFRATIVPLFWLLTRKVRSRVFNQMAVPDILEKVFAEVPGLDVAVQLLDRSKYPVHDFCTQYRESDFNFACRLMEEEGIYYFFDQLEKGTMLVLADASGSAHADIKTNLLFGPGRSVSFVTELNRLLEWEKAQQLRSSGYRVVDHHFEQQTPVSEGKQSVSTGGVKAGTVSHKLKILGDAFAITDFPGEYAHRFDDVALAGGQNSKGVNQIPTDKDRVAKIRLEQETVSGLLIRGTSSCPSFAAGKTFQVTDDANAKGKYLLVSVAHGISQAGDVSGSGNGCSYQNSFTAIPFTMDLPYRAPRLAQRPFIAGAQTAIVVGLDPKKAPNTEILTDKFGRVKVQFHWDRDNDADVDCSCWVRVAQVWAGKRWGASFWPRIGQEVIVAFLEGNPDQPIIVGSVYNATQMPPYLGAGLDSKHKNDPNVSGIKSNTTLGGEGYNEWRFDDTKDKQQFFLHAERDFDLRVKNESRTRIFGNSHVDIGGTDKNGKKFGDLREHVFQDRHTTIERNQVENIKGNLQLLIGGGDGDNGNVDLYMKKDVKETIEGDRHLHAKKNRNVKVDSNESLTVGGNQQHKVSQNHALEAGQAIHLKAGTTLILEAGTQLSLKVGGNFIDIGPAGVSIVGTMVKINSGGSAGSGAGSSPTAPTDAASAAPTAPDQADDSVSGLKSAPK